MCVCVCVCVVGGFFNVFFNMLYVLMLYVLIFMYYCILMFALKYEIILICMMIR